MAKQVIQCGHCSDTFDKWEIALRHECGCEFNPANQGCYTCKYRYLDPDKYCYLDLTENNEDTVMCPKWQKLVENPDEDDYQNA